MLRLLGLVLVLSVVVAAAPVCAELAPSTTRLRACSGAAFHGQMTTDTANGAEALAAARPVAICAVRIKHAGSTGTLHVGGSTLNASSAPGYPLSPGESVSWSIGNLDEIYVDGGTVAIPVAYGGTDGP